MSGVIPLLSLYALMLWTGTNLPLLLLLLIIIFQSIDNYIRERNHVRTVQCFNCSVVTVCATCNVITHV